MGSNREKKLPESQHIIGGTPHVTTAHVSNELKKLGTRVSTNWAIEAQKRGTLKIVSDPKTAERYVTKEIAEKIIEEHETHVPASNLATDFGTSTKKILTEAEELGIPVKNGIAFKNLIPKGQVARLEDAAATKTALLPLEQIIAKHGTLLAKIHPATALNEKTMGFVPLENCEGLLGLTEKDIEELNEINEENRTNSKLGIETMGGKKHFDLSTLHRLSNYTNRHPELCNNVLKAVKITCGKLESAQKDLYPLMNQYLDEKRDGEISEGARKGYVLHKLAANASNHLNDFLQMRLWTKMNELK